MSDLQDLIEDALLNPAKYDSSLVSRFVGLADFSRDRAGEDELAMGVIAALRSAGWLRPKPQPVTELDELVNHGDDHRWSQPEINQIGNQYKRIYRCTTPGCPAITTIVGPSVGPTPFDPEVH